MQIDLDGIPGWLCCPVSTFTDDYAVVVDDYDDDDDDTELRRRSVVGVRTMCFVFFLSFGYWNVPSNNNRFVSAIGSVKREIC